MESNVKNIIDGANESYYRGFSENENIVKCPGKLQDMILGTYVREENKNDLYANTVTNPACFPKNERIDEETLIILGKTIKEEMLKEESKKMGLAA
jgi:hypothetical protein